MIRSQGLQGAQRNEVLGQLVLLHGGDAHDGPVGVADAHEGVFGVIRDEFILDLHVGVDLPERFHIAVQLVRDIGTVIGKVDLGGQIGVFAQDDLIKGGQGFFRGGERSQAEHQAYGQDQGKYLLHWVFLLKNIRLMGALTHINRFRNLSRRSGHHWRFNPLFASIDSIHLVFA